jgi:hypothetical protein
MSDPLERLEQPEYTGENRCFPCTVVNLLIAAVLAALVGRRNRELGIVTFLGAAALVSLRGYLVPGTPELTKRYLPESVLALFDKADQPEHDLPSEITQHAADRAEEQADGAAESDSDSDSESESEPEAETEAETDGESDATTAAHPEREAAEELLGEPMDEVLEAFDVVEPADDDLRLTDSFRDSWQAHIGALDSESERIETLADLFRVDESAVELEVREDSRYYALVDGRSQHNWITEAALLSDLAAHRAIASEDPRWSALVGEERVSLLKGFRVFLESCPECGGTIAPTDESVESCCRSWEVIAIECADCGARMLEVPAEDEYNPEAGAGAAGPPGGFTR